ncbi:hypothetical protein DMC30DRAFT_402703 [Rhodotorula diobovata]|uniref:Uncharacterized protein n=1 Tax=Rhodotorula diobovata TaxID=5288 RepID=A0A5C5FQN8_9BASI|nr:hypothetical protein DMC30DRAFT_402703 [Rhodotorula diobovata]
MRRGRGIVVVVLTAGTSVSEFGLPHRVRTVVPSTSLPTRPRHARSGGESAACPRWVLPGVASSLPSARWWAARSCRSASGR